MEFGHPTPRGALRFPHVNPRPVKELRPPVSLWKPTFPYVNSCVRLNLSPLPLCRASSVRKETRMSDLRSKCLSTKLTREEYAAVAARAGGQPLSEWARDQLLAAAARHALLEGIPAELLALRMIILTLHTDLARGERPTDERVHDIIATSDREKRQLAKARLGAPPRP